MEKRLTGIVTEDEFNKEGCELIFKGPSNLYMFTCEKHCYLTKRLEDEKYKVLAGYVCCDPKISWE